MSKIIEFPKMLYKKGGNLKIGDDYYTSAIAKDKEEEKSLSKEGFSSSLNGSSVSKKKEAPKKEKKEDKA